MMKKKHLITMALLCVTMLSAKVDVKDLNSLPKLQRPGQALHLISNDECVIQGPEPLSLSDFYRTDANKQFNISVLKTLAIKEQTEELLDSVIAKDRDNNNYSRELYEYDADGDIVLLLKQYWDDDANLWVDKYKYEYQYNNDGNQTLYACSSFDSVWVSSWQYEYVWGADAEGNTTKVVLYSSWDEDSHSLVYVDKIEYTLYVGTNVNKQCIDYSYSDGAWLPYDKYVHDIKAYGVICEDDCDYIWIDYIWKNGAWLGQSKRGVIYSEDKSFDRYTIEYKWDNGAMGWATKSVNEYDGSAGNIISTTAYVLNAGEWEALSKTGRDGDYTVHYELINNDFVKIYKDYSVYNSDGLLSSYYRSDWDVKTGSWYVSQLKSGLSWDYLSGEWRLDQYISKVYDRNGNMLNNRQMFRYDSQSDWTERYTWSYDYTYNEDQLVTSSSWSSWSGDEPTYYDNTFTYGDYSIRDSSYYYGEESYTVSLSEDGENKVWIYNLMALGTTFYGVFNDDKSELKIPVNQLSDIASYPDYEFCLIGFYGDNPDNQLTDGDSISCTIASNGKIVINDEFGLSAYRDGAFYTYFDAFVRGATLSPDNLKQPLFDFEHWDELFYHDIYYYYSDHEVSSLKNAAYAASVKTYPNPAQDQLIISGTLSGESLRILNLRGQLQGTYTTTEKETTIDLSTYSAGTYIVTLGEYQVKIIRN